MGHILNRLNQLKELQLINMHNMNEIHIKLGVTMGEVLLKCATSCTMSITPTKRKTPLFLLFSRRKTLELICAFASKDFVLTLISSI